MFVISTLDGEELQAADDDLVMISANTGVLTIQRVEGSELVTTHYSAAAWRSVTHRGKKTSMQRSAPPAIGVIMGEDTSSQRG
ncbi:MAG TPA: hypothetical protein VFR17_00285 [Mycobacterium sp.]|nr:hypothetical protein [Mycobacterium sp.]